MTSGGIPCDIKANPIMEFMLKPNGNPKIPQTFVACPSGVMAESKFDSKVPTETPPRKYALIEQKINFIFDKREEKIKKKWCKMIKN